MKRSFALGILGLATAAVTSYGQGFIFLDNYINSTCNPILVQNGLFSHEFIPIPVGWTVGLYYDPTPNENIVGSIPADPVGICPSALNPALIQATGSGSTASIIVPGYFHASASFLIQPMALTPAQASFTIMLVAYNGSSWYTSTAAGHSAPIYIQNAAPSVPYGSDIGLAFPANTPMFAIWIVPEPDTLALASLGGLALWLLHRKKT